MRSRLAGSGFVALASLEFGVVVVLGKVASDRGMPAIPTLSVRFAIAALLLWMTCALTRTPMLPASGERLRLWLLGGFGYGVEAAFFFLAIDRGTASAVTLLFFVYPVIVTIVSALIGVRMPGVLIGASLVAAVLGAGLVVASSGGLDITVAGIWFAIGSATTFAFYLMGADRVLTRTSSIAGAAWVAAAASVALAAYSVATSSMSIPDGTDEWLPVLGMGAFTAGAFAALFAGLRVVGAVRTSIIAALEPLSTAVLAVVFLGEPVRTGTVAGGALILGGAIAAGIARAGTADEEQRTIPDVPQV